MTHAREARERQALACPFPGGKADGQLGRDLGRLHLRLPQGPACQLQVWVPGHETVRKLSSQTLAWGQNSLGRIMTADATQADEWPPATPGFPQGSSRYLPCTLSPRTPPVSHLLSAQGTALHYIGLSRGTSESRAFWLVMRVRRGV